MRKILLIYFLLFLILNLSQESLAQDENRLDNLKEREEKSKEDKWLGWDKAGHFFVSGFLAGASYSIYHKSFHNTRESSVYFSTILTLSIGIGKEVNDRKKPQNRFSYKDLIYDILGISAGLIIATN